MFDVDFANGLTLIEIADGVTVDEVKSKKSGSDLNAVSEWNQTDKFKQVASESTKSMIQKDLLLD